MSREKRFLLLGHPVGHSVSPAIHTAAYRALGAPHRYQVVDCPTEADVRAQVARLRSGEIAGANVTVPWKRLALDLADHAEASACQTAVANVLALSAQCEVTAYNTDAAALAEEIRALHPSPERAVVIGAGGAAQAAVVACQMLGVRDVRVSNRDWLPAAPRASWKRAAALEALGAVLCTWPEREGGSIIAAALRADVIIQATSAGMRGAGPGQAVSEWIPWQELASGAVAIDVVYNPRRTPFLDAAERANVPHAGGLGMLVRQAALALRVWLAADDGWVEPDFALLYAAAERALEEQGRS